MKGTLLQNYALPAGIAPDQIAKPPTIAMTIGADGTLSGIKLRKSSGNSFVIAYTVSTAGAFGALILCGHRGAEAVSYEDLSGIGDPPGRTSAWM